MDDSFITLLRRFPGNVLEDLQSEGFSNIWSNPTPDRMSREDMLKVSQGAIGIMVAPGDASFDGAFMDAIGPQLRVISCYAVGYDNINVSAALERGVAIGYTPHAPTEPTADCAWLLILGAARHAAWGDRLIRSGKWKGVAPDDRLGQRIIGKTILIVGAGRIGTAVARRALGWGMSILYADPDRKPHLEAAPYHAQYVELDQGLAQADIVTLHCPLIPETYHLIDAARLQRFKPGSILVNTSRGSIIDETALVEALRNGPLAAGGLDVYEREPQIEAGLLSLDNVLLLPHLGSATVEDRHWMTELAVENLIAGIRGQSLPHQAH